MGDDVDDSSNSILYDINTYSYPSWTNEQEFSKLVKIRRSILDIPKIKSETIKVCYLSNLGSWITKKLFNSSSNEDTLKFLFATSKPWNEWKLAVSETGSFALLKDNCIEYYESLSQLSWRIQIQTQIIRICNLFFNQRTDMLVFTDESGSFYFYDITDGSELFQYKQPESIEFENAICKMIFLNKEVINYKSMEQDIVELLMTVSFSGTFNVYSISSSRHVEKLYSKSLLSIVPNGVYCAEVDSKSEFLILGSFVSNSSAKQSANGLSIWRILNEEPWIKHFETVEQDLENVSFLPSNMLNTIKICFLQILIFLNLFKKNFKSKKNFDKMNFAKIEYVTKIVISPDNNFLAVIYVSGKLAIFSFPSLRLKNEWFMTEQPCYNDMNSDIVENPHELRKFKQIYQIDFRLVDVGWWSEKVLILARGSGLLSLVSVEDLSNLMGSNQQWLNPYPSIYLFLKDEFFILDCSCDLSIHTFQTPTSLDQQNQANEDENSLSNLNESYEINNNLEEQNDEGEEDDDGSWYSYTIGAMKAKVYNLVGIERLNVPMKKMKFLRRKFSILHMKSTTPSELFERKLQAEEYGEALILARSYKLDTDLVYQKQWHSHAISETTIKDYLSKIKKRSWILHECEERLPVNIETTKYLLEFGLAGTDLDVLVNKSEDNRFLISRVDDEEFDDSPLDRFNPEQAAKKKRRREEIMREKLKLIDVNNLTLMQKELCTTRIKLLNYLDRLELYELILGGPIKASELFDCEKYKSIRSKPILDVTLDYAREGNAKAVEILFAYYYDDLRDQQLLVLGNFPETVEPDIYEKLLPKIENGKVVLFDEREELRSDKDWIESTEFTDIYESYRRSSQQQQQPIDEKKTTELNVESIQNWYYNRTVEIENESGLIDNALSLAELAIVNGCKNMNELMENLRTLFTLAYECRKCSPPQTKDDEDEDVFYSLDHIAKMSDLERLILIMDHAYESTNELYVKNLQEWLLPFVARQSTLRQREALLRGYLLHVSKEDLIPCLKLLQLKLKTNSSSQISITHQSTSLHSQQTASPLPAHLKVLSDINLTSILIECLYVSERADQVETTAQQIVNELCKSSIEPSQVKQSTQSQQEQIKQALDHLKACELFRKYGLKKTLAYIKNSCSSVESCREALTSVTWFASKRATQLKPNEWAELMKDLRYLQANLYKSLVTYRECNEIFLISLLGSRNIDNIRLAGDWLRDIYNVDRSAAVNLVIKASQEYFNASSNYLDPDMEYARSCLNLVESMLHESKSLHASKHKDDVDASLEICLKHIKDEHNLIHSMKIIAEFDYNILPVQIRVSENRMDILRDIVDKKDEAYKSYDKLIELAELLNIGVKTKSETKDKSKEDHAPVEEVLCELKQLIAEHALKKRNLSIAKKMCIDLIEHNYGPAWPCVYNLAFSLSSNLIDTFKINMVKDNVFLSIAHYQFDNRYLQKDKFIEKLRQIEELLSFVVAYCDIDCIQEAIYQKLNITKTRTRLEFSQEVVSESNDITKLELDNLNKFYLNCDKSIEDREVYERKNRTIASCLETLVNLRATDEDINENFASFTRSCNQLAQTDASLLFSYLLELDNVQIESIFEHLGRFEFNSPLSYEFLLHLFALNIVNKENSQRADVFKPSALNEYILGVELDQESIYSKVYKKVDKLYSEFNNKSELHDLNQNIDVKRFESDTVYRNETILGLSDSPDTFKLACSLAKFYSLDLWEVYMSFTRNLFLDYEQLGLSLDDVQTHVKPLLSVLNRKFERFSAIMNEEILEKINGRDLDRLIAYYTILNDKDSQVHVKLLNKIKSVDFTEGFDYKIFMEKPLEAIEPFLEDSNVPFFTKLVSKLPTKNSSSAHSLSASQINVVWCLKKFWTQVNTSGDEKENNSPVDILDTIAESVKKIDMNADLPYFVNELTLSRRSTSKLSLSMRRELAKRIGRLFKHAPNDKFSKDLLRIQSHLKLVENLVKCVGDDEKLRTYVEQLDFEMASDLSQTSEEKVHRLEEILIRMFFDSCPIEKLNQLINLMGYGERTSVKRLIKLALNKISTMLKHDNYANKMNTLLESISNYLNSVSSKQHEEVILTDDDVMECMRAFCNDQQIDINTRLVILEKLKKIIKTMSDDDLMLLLVYKTNAILANCDFFDGKADQIEAPSIESEKKRHDLLLKWIDYAKSIEEYSALLNLILIWPSFNRDTNPIFQYLVKLATNSSQVLDVLGSLFEQEEKSLSMSAQELESLEASLSKEASKWNDQNEVLKRNFLKICLVFKSEQNLEFVTSYLKSVDLKCFQLMESEDDDLLDSSQSYQNLVNDNEISSLILKENFYCHIVNTKLYSVFLRNQINNKGRNELLRIVGVLKENGLTIEAGDLVIFTENFFRSYKNLSVSLALIDKLS